VHPPAPGRCEVGLRFCHPTTTNTKSLHKN
jgi:hypothetical protein